MLPWIIQDVPNFFGSSWIILASTDSFSSLQKNVRCNFTKVRRMNLATALTKTIVCAWRRGVTVMPNLPPLSRRGTRKKRQDSDADDDDEDGEEHEEGDE